MSEANKALVRRVFEEAFNERKVALIDELYPDCAFFAPAVGEVRGEAYRQFMKSVIEAFPDGRWKVEDQVAEGDRVATRWSFIGKHRNTLMGIAPSGKEVALSGIMIDRIIGGRFVAEWEEWDTLGMMHQLGAIPLAPKVENTVAD